MAGPLWPLGGNPRCTSNRQNCYHHPHHLLSTALTFTGASSHTQAARGHSSLGEKGFFLSDTKWNKSLYYLKREIKKAILIGLNFKGIPSLSTHHYADGGGGVKCLSPQNTSSVSGVNSVALKWPRFEWNMNVWVCRHLDDTTWTVWRNVFFCFITSEEEVALAETLFTPPRLLKGFMD